MVVKQKVPHGAVSARSKARVARLLTPPVATTGVDIIAPHGLTLRTLITSRQSRWVKLRQSATIVQLADGRLLSIRFLLEHGWDI